MNNDEISRVCHEANRAFCVVLGDDAPPEWDYLEEQYKQSTRIGVLKALEGVTPEELHASWMRERLSQGWKYGEKLDRANKVHPNLVPYHKLSEEQKKKDALFHAVVKALADKSTK